MQLNGEQKDIIISQKMGSSLIKGAVGSGKTTVAINRMSFLLNEFCPSQSDKVLMITYNKALVSYLKEIYSKTNIDNINPSDKRYEIINISRLIYRYFIYYARRNGLKAQILADIQKNESIFKRCILQVQNLNKDKIISLDYFNFLLEEIQWLKANGYKDIKLEEYQKLSRKGRTKVLGKNQREAIYFLMKYYNEALSNNELVDFEDQAIYALEYIKNTTLPPYRHIIVDESQDLSKVQLEFICHLFNPEIENSSIIFVSDTAQSIYTNSWLKDNSFASIGFNMKGKSNILTLAKTYRTTTQISETSYSLIEHDCDIINNFNFVKPSLVDKQGDYPILKGFNTFYEEMEYVSNLINILLKKYEYKDIAIIARTSDLLSQYSSYLQRKSISCSLHIHDSKEIDFNYNSVKLITMHSAKGLEFKVIIIVGLCNQIIPNKNAIKVENPEDFERLKTDERRLLYVAMTRAKEKLYLSYHGEKSILLNDIDCNFLRIDEKAKVRSYYEPTIEKYHFKSKIMDLYLGEEKTRQWFLNELQETYKYPSELIDIEYKLQFGSKQGFVDIVIFNNDIPKIPYIFIETKKRFTNLDEALDQLKSYMSVIPQCQYGIATDSNNFIVIDNQMNFLDDIPDYKLNNTMKSTISTESYIYIDLKHNKNYEFLRDGDKNKELIVLSDSEDNIYGENELTRINILTDIAAGIPIEINDEITGEFYLPSVWVKNNNDCFILKVKGDSMINANIENGDYVLIKFQPFAENTNLVAVDIDGSTTLKRYQTMGSDIILIPENKNYEPIKLMEGQFRIIGIAIAIIKMA